MEIPREEISQSMAQNTIGREVKMFLLLFLLFADNLNATSDYIYEKKPYKAADFKKNGTKIKAHINPYARKVGISLVPLNVLKKTKENLVNQKIPEANAALDSQEFLKKIEKFFNSLKTLRAKFVQMERYGETEGMFILKRPHLMKMKYFKAENEKYRKPTIIIKNNHFIYYDHELKEKTSTSIYSSPLSFFLDTNVSLANNVEILEFKALDNSAYIKVSKKGPATEEAVALIFNQNPLMLKEWRIFANKADIFPKTIIKFSDEIKIDEPIDSEEFENFN